MAKKTFNLVLTEDILKTDKVNATDKLVFVALKTLATDGKTTADNKAVAKVIGMSERTAAYGIKRLNDAKFIKIKTVAAGKDTVRTITL